MAIDGLNADIDTLRKTKPRYFKQWLELAAEEDRRVVMEAVMDVHISSGKLATLLTQKYDIPITRETIEAYRGH